MPPVCGSEERRSATPACWRHSRRRGCSRAAGYYRFQHMKPLVCTSVLLAAQLCAQPSAQPADLPAPRTDQNSITAHEQLLQKAKQGRIDIYFEGDSIVRRWGATDYPDYLANWKQNFFGWNAADFGWGADRIQNILWRLKNGELDG